MPWPWKSMLISSIGCPIITKHLNLWATFVQGCLMGRLVNAGLWALFVLLLVISGMRLLFGCALAVPFPVSLQFCPAPIDVSLLLHEIEIRRAQEARIHEAELAIARVAPCSTTMP